MGLGRYASRLMQQAVLSLGLAMMALLMAVGGLGFLAAAVVIWLAHHLGGAAACAITGGGLIFFGLFTMLVGNALLNRLRRRAPGLMADVAATISAVTSLAGLVIRRDPKRALLAALVAGAVAEYFTVPDKPRS